MRKFWKEEPCRVAHINVGCTPQYRKSGFAFNQFLVAESWCQISFWLLDLAFNLSFIYPNLCCLRSKITKKNIDNRHENNNETNIKQKTIYFFVRKIPHSRCCGLHCCERPQFVTNKNDTMVVYTSYPLNCIEFSECQKKQNMTTAKHIPLNL